MRGAVRRDIPLRDRGSHSDGNHTLTVQTGGVFGSSGLFYGQMADAVPKKRYGRRYFARIVLSLES